MAKKLADKDGCGGCEYYTASPREVWGICRRDPPVAVVDDEGCAWAQPSVFAVEWCGEFRRRCN